MPKPDPSTKRGKQEGAAPKVSRLQMMKRGGVTVDMPPNPAPHIIDRLLEIGLVQHNGMGASPISWIELDAWCRRTSIDLAPWESRLLVRLSRDYLAESGRAESENCPPPWRAPVSAKERELEVARLQMVLG